MPKITKLSNFVKVMHRKLRLFFRTRCIFISFRNKADIIVHYDNTRFWILLTQI